MLRLMTVCGSGLVTSFMVEMNIQTILKELGVENKVSVAHTDLGSSSSGQADVYLWQGFGKFCSAFGRSKNS